MADLLTHVLIAYVVLTVASWQIPRIENRFVILGMAGTAIPDLVKLRQLVSESFVEELLGIPFSFAPLGTLGGVVVIAGIAAMMFRRNRLTVYAYVLFGALSALFVDGLRSFADGRADFWLFPIWWRPPTPSLYVSSDPRGLGVVLLVSVVVFLVNRRDLEAWT